MSPDLEGSPVSRRAPGLFVQPLVEFLAEKVQLSLQVLARTL